ncbi:beta-propeller domain-containing protein [Streptosporangium vulgare]|uniref:beta-propeller domain-containing protein n=1 Tax=Streptosporangium vulgare TaxID=46190 RepID=UPI003CD08CC8
MFQKDSGSEAEWDPHAFLYLGEDGVAVLPVNSWTGTEQTNGTALVLRIDDSAIDRTGTVSHPRPRAGGERPHGLRPGHPPARSSSATACGRSPTSASRSAT